MNQSVSKIFGIGLSHTGTHSFNKALNILGFDILHYPIDEVTNRELKHGHYKLSILENCDGITDITVVPYYAQLESLFPGSKFILTVRDKDAWLKSMKTLLEEKDDDKTKPDYELKIKIR